MKTVNNKETEFIAQFKKDLISMCKENKSMHYIKDSRNDCTDQNP